MNHSQSNENDTILSIFNKLQWNHFGEWDRSSQCRRVFTAKETCGSRYFFAVTCCVTISYDERFITSLPATIGQLKHNAVTFFQHTFHGHGVELFLPCAGWSSVCTFLHPNMDEDTNFLWKTHFYGAKTHFFYQYDTRLSAHV